MNMPVIRPVHLIHSVVSDGDIPLAHNDFFYQMYISLGFDTSKKISKWTMFGMKLPDFRRIIQAKEGGIDPIAESPWQMSKRHKVTGEVSYHMTARKLYRRSDLLRMFKNEVMKCLK